MTLISVLTNSQLGTVKAESDSKLVEELFETNVETEDFSVPDIICENEAKNYIGRLKDEEKDLYTFVFSNKDGSNTMRVYGHPVKYVDDDGEVKDISLLLKKSDDGSFKSYDHKVDVTFNSEIKDGISIKYQDIDIISKPLIQSSKLKISKDSKKVTYSVDNKTAYAYSLTYTGIKEEIIVNEYTGQTEYEFVINTNGLHPIKIDESVYLADKDDNAKVNLGDVIVYTADGHNNTMGELKFDVIKENQEYKFTIVLDSDYLKNEKTTYPIIIDPTIEITTEAGAIEDITINQFYTLSGAAANLYVGRDTNTSLNRTLMRFPFLSLSGKSSSQIYAASVELTDILPIDNQNITVECRIYKYNAPAWSESGTTTWSSVGNDYIGTLQDYKTISGAGNAGTHRYSFNILNAAKQWAEETQYPSKGLVFKSTSAFESQTGSSMKYWKKTFGSYNRTSEGPSLFITYITPWPRKYHYSKFDPNKYDMYGNLPNIGDYSEEIRFRQNCYGYAFGYVLYCAMQVYYSAEDEDHLMGYKQIPGEFVTGSNRQQLQNISPPTPNLTANEYMVRVVNNLYYESKQLNFTISSYYPDEDDVEQFGGNKGKRLIAVVTNSTDFHFYMQHDNGEWSHKIGSGSIQKNAINSITPLNNGNIQSMAKRGAYSGGALRFFTITNSAIMDFPHDGRCCDDFHCNHNDPNTLYLNERGGDYIENSKLVNTGTIHAKFDFHKDVDVYCFTPNITTEYVITISNIYDAHLKCSIKDNCNMLKYSLSDDSVLTTSIRLVKDVKYYFVVSNEDHTLVPYVFIIY